MGCLPSIEASNPTSTVRSPYSVSLSDLVLRFNTSAERRRILEGLLDYRAALHSIGLAKGFQWVDGSFVENVELTEKRAPNDVDVVTFFELMPGVSQQQALSLMPALFDQAGVKKQFHVDTYFVDLAAPNPTMLVESAAYWYSMWAHRRDERWKGFLSIDLAPAEDASARANLASSVPTNTP